jgi:FkbM family methyltransferase
MGHVQYKYTRTYFTKTNTDGSVADYGVEGYEEFMDGKIRGIDLHILDRINFVGRRVLEFGFGRGEAIKYVLEHGAACYEGVDFSEHAVAIATEFLEKHKLTIPTLHHADALDFLKEYKQIHKAEKRRDFDIILMLDFVEHVPRTELREIISLLRGIMSDTAVLAINTPVFRVDNDVIADDMSPLNAVNTIDTSDMIEETAGMHCNKYTLISLQEFMCTCGFDAISEAHFYAPANAAPSNFRATPSFRIAWQEAVALGRPLSPDWEEDVVEYAYQQPEVPHWYTFNQGRLNGISLLLTAQYQQYFPAGEYDTELFDDLDQQDAGGKTIFDIGGFMGVSSMLFAQLVGSSGRVVCFEPNPWNRQRISSNLSRNPNLAKNISLYGLALGDTSGKMEMLFSDNVDTGFSSTSQSVSSHGTLPKDHLLSLGFYYTSASLATLDDFVQATGTVPHILKVDIEGAEHLFLSGAETTIREHRPLIYMEVHSPFCAWLCSQKLMRLGYTTRLLHEEDDGRIMIKAKSQQETLALADSAALSRELLDLLRLERQRQNKLLLYNNDTQIKLQWAEIKLQNTKTELDIANTELHSTTDELFKLKIELNNTKAEIRSTKDELNSTKDDMKSTKDELNDITTELHSTKAELQDALRTLAWSMKIVNHPIIKLQRSVYKTIRNIIGN